MRKRYPLFVIGLALSSILWLPPTFARAQLVPGWDFYIAGVLGVAAPMSTDVEINSAIGKSRADGVELETSFAYGGKLGAWTTHFREQTGVDFGLEFDATFFSPDVKEQPITVSVGGVVPVTACCLSKIDVDAKILAGNLMLRVPMYISNQFPNGRVQWAFGAGGGVQLAKAEAADGSSDKATSAVFQALLNGKFFMTRHFALLLEYKFSHADQTFNFPLGEFKGTADVHHVLGGLALHF